MDYLFDEEVFKKHFEVKDEGVKGPDSLRLRHNPNKKFRLFPYQTKANVYIVTELEELISDFFKFVLGVETEEIQFEKLCVKIKENLEIDIEDEIFFDKMIGKMFFKNGQFVTNNIGLYVYQCQSEKSVESLAFFLFCVLGLDANDYQNIKKAEENYPYNILEELIVQSVQAIPRGKDFQEKRYFPIIQSIQEKFKKDFEYMLMNGMTSKEDIAQLLDVYYFYYITQTSVILDQFCLGKREKEGLVAFYYALEWEKVSGNRKCCKNGWGQLREKVNHLFCHAITMELINQHKDENLMYDYIMLYEFIGRDTDRDRLVAEQIRKVETAYTNCIGDYKKFNEIPVQDGINETDQALKHLFKCVEEQFLNTGRTGPNKSYINKFEKYAKERWLKNRGKAGMVLNLTERDIIFLTKISLGDLKQMKLTDLFQEYESRGIFLDNTSQEFLQEFFTRLNLIDKKSDSGDAQYVKRIL